MLINLALNFVVACIGTFVTAALARWIAGYFAGAHSARVGAFGAAIGYVVGKYSYVRPLGSPIDAWAPIASFAGAVVALAIIWFVLFKRPESVRNGPGSK